MPIYEYLCKGCQHRFEYLLLSSSAAPKCPACESRELEQLISAPAVHSESSTQAHLSAAHRKAAATRSDRLRDQHQHLHEHFEDRPTRETKSHPGEASKNQEELP